VKELLVTRREVAYYDLESAAGLDAAEALFVERLRANEDAAYDELVRTYNASVFHVAYRMLGDSGEAADVVQEIFLKVFRNILRFRGDSALRTWIFRIALSEILNRLRWWKRRFRSMTMSIDEDREGQNHSVHLSDCRPSPHQALEAKEQEAAIQQALRRLSSDRRSILILRDIEGFSYVEIAEVLGISIGTVKSRLARARADMKKTLMPYLSVQRIEPR
jgi:RNA polymerase sigma-70 factor (ECF subfamily)